MNQKNINQTSITCQRLQCSHLFQRKHNTDNRELDAQNLETTFSSFYSSMFYRPRVIPDKLINLIQDQTLTYGI